MMNIQYKIVVFILIELNDKLKFYTLFQTKKILARLFEL